MQRLLLLLLIFLATAPARQHAVLVHEQFDSVQPPQLPPGWMSSANRSPAGDFVTTVSSPRTSPHAVMCSNASISQSLTSPVYKFPGSIPVAMEFYTARSGTYTAGLIVEASTDEGSTFPHALSDTIHNPGVAGYVLTRLSLQPALGQHARVSFRWRLIGVPGGGSSGTFRLDDISVLCQPADDLGLASFKADRPEPLSAGKPHALKATILNAGIFPASEFKVNFFHDRNRNSIPEREENFAEITTAFLAPGDSISIRTDSPPLNAGENCLIALLEYPRDGNPQNDTAFVSLQGVAERESIIINEIMYDPLAGQCEWVELFNRSSAVIDLYRWSLSDRPSASGSTVTILADTAPVVDPQGFVVLAADTTIFHQYPELSSPQRRSRVFTMGKTSGFSLNNDGDCVIIRDGLGVTMDSVSYLSSWHHPDISDTKGRSLERINPDLPSNDRRNWSTSPSRIGGTPGERNGIFTVLVPSSASLFPSPNPFSPDGDGFEDFCVIRYNLPLATSIIRLTVFDVKGRLIRTLANTELSGAHGELVWDGRDESRQGVRIGPYILFLEGIDGEAGVLATCKAVVVVAAKL